MLRQHKGRRGGWCHSQPSSSLHCPRFPPWYQAGRRLPPRWERDHLQSLFFSPQVHWTSVLLMWPSSFPGEFFGDNFERRHTWGGNQAADICIGAPIAIGPQMAFIMAPDGGVNTRKKMENLYQYGSSLWKRISRLEREEEDIEGTSPQPYKGSQRPDKVMTRIYFLYHRQSEAFLQ